MGLQVYILVRSSTSILYQGELQRHWLDLVDVQSRLSLHLRLLQ